jgi:hypothetical protein
VNFLDLPLKSRRAAFAKMDAADKAKKGASLGKKPSAKRKTAAKKATVKKAAPSAKPSQQVSRQYRQTGQPTAADVETLIANYRTMTGKDPSPAQLAKLRRKRR